jgi:hypothetical protein
MHRPTLTGFVLVALFGLVSACGGDASGSGNATDPGVRDVGSDDDAAADAGRDEPTDAGRTDAGDPDDGGDAGGPESDGATDADDAGPSSDSGPDDPATDAATGDATDAGPTADAPTDATGDTETTDGPRDPDITDATGDSDSGDVSGDGGTTDAPEDVGAADTITGADATVSGNIFWNRGFTPPGSLLIALSATNPVSAPLVAERTFDTAVLPTEYELRDVPHGIYYVFAFLDVDHDSSWDDPGPEDYVTISVDAIELSDRVTRVTGINVELR